MNDTAAKAIQNEISFLEDNRNRYRTSGCTEDDPTVARHTKKIKELREVLEEKK